uniref:Endonuclease/exonuclease/phosphatase domain-containing protein n=1 Tax=Cacopsylla melanoneura TaxID=428564 RepID=A0A8D8YC86_9HEMI
MSFEDIEELNINIDTQIYENIEEWNKNELKNRNKNDLIILHSNIQNLSRKSFHTLQLYLENKTRNIDIIILSEINCKPEEIQLYHLQNFNVTYCCRKKKKGGGIIIYTKENISITELKHMTFKYTENIEIQIDRKNIILNVMYKPPKINPNEFIKELKKWLKIEEVKQKDIILIGDVNINTLVNNNITQSYLELLSDNKIINTIRKPTRVETRKGKITTSCIDHVNLRTKNKFTSGIIEDKIADHYFIYTKIYESKINDDNEMVKINILDQEKINQMIMEYNWDELINENNDSEELYNKFVYIYNELLKKSEKTIKIKKKYVGNTWVSEELRRLIKLKNEKWKNVKRNPNNIEMLNEYKEIRNKLTNKITQAKKRSLIQLKVT